MIANISSFTKIAWRNIWRNKRRSLIAIGTISFAVVTTAITRSLEYGTYAALKSHSVRLYIGDIKIHRTNFHNRTNLSLSFNENEQDWMAITNKSKGLIAYSKRLSTSGLAISDSLSSGALLVGIEPNKEKRITRFASMIKRGDELASVDSESVLLGESLANVLNVEVDDSVVVITHGYYHDVRANIYHVKGTIRTGDTFLDQSMLLMTLTSLQSLLSMEGLITEVIFKTDELDYAKRYATSTRELINKEGFEIISWQTAYPELVQLIAWDKAIGDFFLLFLFIVVGFEIYNTTSVGITERIKEFGVLESMGMKPIQVSEILLLESIIKIFIAISIGLGFSFSTVFLFKNYPIPLTGNLKDALTSWGFVTNIYFSADVIIYIEPIIYTTIIAILSLFSPIFKIIRLSPIEALRTP